MLVVQAQNIFPFGITVKDKPDCFAVSLFPQQTHFYAFFRLFLNGSNTAIYHVDQLHCLHLYESKSTHTHTIGT